MREAWRLAALAIVFFLVRQSSSTNDTNHTTITEILANATIWENENYNSTAPATDDNDDDDHDNDNQWTADMSTTASPKTLPIYKTGMMSSEEYQKVRTIQGWVYLGLESFALVLMSLSAAAFLQDRHSPSNVYLAAICLAEAWYMLVLFTHYTCKLRKECFVSLTYTQISIWSVSYTGMSARRCVYVLNALVSVQRFVAVAFPIQARYVRLLQRPRVPLALVVILTFLIHLYRPLQYTTTRIQDDFGTSYTQGFSALYNQNTILFVAFADVAHYATIYLPMLTCLVSNILLITALARHKQDLYSVTQKHDANKSKAERQMTVMILGSTFLMILLNTPVNINEAVSMYSNDYGILKKEHFLYMVMRSYFSIMSQACDILVVLSYLVLSANFRRRFLSLFVCRACKPLGPARQTTRRSASTGETNIP